MNARQPALSASIQQRDMLERHNRVLVHALQTGHPVMYREQKRFIHTLLLQTSGGDIDVDVYLTGSPERIAPEEITLATQIS